MTSLFRSEPMALCQLFLQSEAAYQCINEIGEIGLVQFIDLNAEVNVFQRKFVNDVRRCDEMERCLRYIEKEIKNEEIHIEEEDAFVETPLPKDLIDMEAKYGRIEDELKQVNGNVGEMNVNYTKLEELKWVLRKVDEFFETRKDVEGSVEATNIENATVSEKTEVAVDLEASVEELQRRPVGDNLNFIAGVIPNSRYQNFERMLWRVGRGIIFCHQMEIDVKLSDVDGGNPELKSVFIIFFPGDQLKTKVRKICEAFRGNVYPCPANAEKRREASVGVLTRLEDMMLVFQGSKDHRCRVLTEAAKNIRNWLVQVAKMKSIFTIMNMLNIDVTQKCFIAECWCPENELKVIQQALRNGTEAAGSSFPCIINRVETKESPPTYNKTNKFTSGFQNIVDAYGVGVYREMNPAPYAIITFPFLFAVMFGDAGHGILMTLIALTFIMYEDKLGKIRDEIVSTFYGGRYIILFMGLFSIYTGTIYNDWFSKSVNIFGSSWIVPPIEVDKDGEKLINLDPQANFRNHSYAYGIDPIWMISANKIQFTNSYKMKMAIIMGVMHMMFGVLLSAWNHNYFKDQTGFPAPRSTIERAMRRTLNIWSQLIPEVLFLASLFGYLVFMIIYKWLLPLGAPFGQGASCSRSILILFINMFMMADPAQGTCYQNELFHGMRTANVMVVLVALISVPWLLFVKPLYLVYLNSIHKVPPPADFVPIISDEEPIAEEDSESTGSSRRKSEVSLHTLKDSKAQQEQEQETAVLQETYSHHDEEFEFDVGEIVIHQIIHTIEYCLGAISNTASYLRLWALSLAHAQLSEVLWSMVLGGALFPGGEYTHDRTFGFSDIISAIKLFGSFAGWAVLTVCILLVMEGLSAFLHAIRLHWVEFMNKFFKGEGYLFTPYNFKEVIFNIDA